MKKQEALNSMVFVFNYSDEIEKTNLYDHIMESADETTTPRGVGKRLHVRENEDEATYELWSWGALGNNPYFIDSFDTEEEAEEELFARTYEYDFMTDDQRDTSFFYTRDEAENVLKERLEDI